MCTNMAKYFTENEIEQMKIILKEKLNLLGYSYSEVYQEDANCTVFVFHHGQAKLPVIISKTNIDKESITRKYGSFGTAYTSNPIYTDNIISDIILSMFEYNEQKPPQKNLKFKSIR